MVELDTIIENGLVVSENETKKLNIGIKNQEIAYLGDENLEAKTKINAENLFLIPTALMLELKNIRVVF